MSFILDALKKSEEQRQGGAAPRTVRKRVMTMSPVPLTRWPLLVLVLLVPLALAGGWWLRGTPAKTPEVLAPAVEVVEQAAAEQVVVEQTPVEQDVTEQPSAGQPVVEQTSSGPAVVEQIPVVADRPSVLPAPAVNEPLPVEESLASIAKTQPEIQQDTVSPAPVREPLSLYRNLSTNLRAQMPPLTLSMHFFTEDPQQRLVRINNRLVREGGWVADELTVEEIVDTGVVLNFAGMLFELRNSGR